MKVAIVHEWLEIYAGSERVLECLLAMFPQADLFAIVDFVPEPKRGFLQGRRVTTSFIQKLPLARRAFRKYLGLMPIAVEQFDLAGYDVVISSNHAVAKGVITGPDQIHISYVHSPMRYAWDLQSQYLRQSNLERGLSSLYARWLLHRLRNWDVRSSTGVDLFIANSTYIAARIRKTYRREAIVVPPPVDVARFALGNRARTAQYMVASRFAPYKQVNLIVEAFSKRPDRQLLVIGDGPERGRVVAAAGDSSNIVFRPPVEQGELVELMQTARAFIYAAEEDFGISMVEAQACGTPLIAFGRGGSRDIVVSAPANSPTGVLFDEQTPESLLSALDRFEAMMPPIKSEDCRNNALRFSTEAFRAAIFAVVNEAFSTRQQKAVPTPGTLMDGLCGGHHRQVE